jgi:glycosyltransferase involved in cell wall biosynthesis
MHVLIYTPHWKKGGIERVAKYIVEGLAHEMHFSILTEDIPDPTEQYRLPASVNVFFRKLNPFNREAELVLRHIIKRLDPDVVLVMASNRTLFTVPRALVDLPYPIILSEHNSDKQLVEKFYGEYWLLNAARRMGDFNHVLHFEYADSYPHTGCVRAINNPIIPSHASADVSTSDNLNIILNVSRYDLGQKQQDILVRSFAKIAHRHPTWELHFYGPDWFGGKAKLKKLVKRLKLTKRVNVQNATDDVSGIMQGAKIFAFPSAFEGSPLVVGEAIANGLPVIGFAECDGVNHIIQDGINGVLVHSSVRDVDAFARCLDSLILGEKDRLRFSEYAFGKQTNHDLDVFVEKWRDLFLEAASLKGRNRLAACTEIEKDYINFVKLQLFPPKGTHYPMLAGLKRKRGVSKFIDKLLNRF